MFPRMVSQKPESYSFCSRAPDRGLWWGPGVVGAGLVLLSSLGAADLAQTGAAIDKAWRSLFDGTTLTNWQSTKFVGEGAVKVENGQIILEAGSNLTGINWIGPELPTTNYEIALQAMRVEGSDFFAGVTFAVAESFCSLILGGWGGTVVGLSSINGMDASENETSQSIQFESGRWYSIRIRVTPAKIETWIDDKQIINEDIKGKKIHTRFEMDPSKPFGIASWRTKAALRDLRLRRLN
jgi:3-keto-disaccharide hydrolase